MKSKLLQNQGRFRHIRIYATLITLTLAVIIAMAILRPKFISWGNFINMGHQMAITAIISFAVTTVIITKGTDLSTGANIALSAMVGALALRAGMPVWVCLLLIVLTGTLVGLANGIMIAYLGISPFIATFAMQSLARGITVSISGNRSIQVTDPMLLFIGTGRFLGVPISIWLMLVLFGVWWILLNRTMVGRYIYATGGNFNAANASGINARFMTLLPLLLTGASVGIASILYIGRVSSAQALGGVGLEFDVLTAVFVGGVLITGGEGTATGALLGTILVTVVKTAMSFLGVMQFVTYIVTGCFVLLAVVIYQPGMLDNLKLFCVQTASDLRNALSGKKARGTDELNVGGKAEQHTLDIEGVTKSFSGFVALNDINTTISSGEMVGLVGENGAGKSTLVNILAGVFEPTKGRLLLDGQETHFHSPQDSKNKGIGVIHQHYSLVPELDIAQNLFYNQEPKFLGIVRRKKMREQAKKLLQEFNLDLPVETKVYRLTVGQCQLLEVVKATLSDPWLLIMDEPTSSLSQAESQRLYELIDQVLARNVAIIYISHKMQEVFQICRRAVVLRDGNLVGDVEALCDITEHELVNMMVGRQIEQMFPYTESSPGQVAIEVNHLSDGKVLKDISFKVHHGELVVLAGLMGAGKTETAECLYGLRKIKGGSIAIEGKPMNRPRFTKMPKHSIGFIPEDRHHSGIVPRMSIAHNLSLIWLRLNAFFGFINVKKEKQKVDELIEQVNVRPPDPDKEVRFLSGGNQQKVVLGKWMAVTPEIFILDDPTRGVDVGAKSEIHHIIAEYKKNGAAILMMSSELTEVLNVADKIYVLHNGRTVKELAHGTNENEVMHYAFGLEGAEGGAVS